MGEDIDQLRAWSKACLPFPPTHERGICLSDQCITQFLCLWPAEGLACNPIFMFVACRRPGLQMALACTMPDLEQALIAEIWPVVGQGLWCI